MASTVISGDSNPSYINNTGQNVRVVINYMVGTTIIPARGTANPPRFFPIVPSTITINWAGVSATTSSEISSIVIGRNLAYSELVRDVVPASTAPGGGPGGIVSPVSPLLINTLGLTISSNNAAGGGGRVGPLPTELILAPGQTFSAVCGVHNIVVIPENG